MNNVTILVLLCAICITQKYLRHNPIQPKCMKFCHELPPGIHLPAWHKVNNDVLCFDHMFLDGARIMHKLGHMVLPDPKHMVDRAPSEYLYSCTIESLQQHEFTPYEVFTARVGRIVRRMYPDLTTVRHTSVNHKARGGVTPFLSASAVFIDVPIGVKVHIKEQPKKSLLSLDTVRWLNRRYSHTLDMMDLRFIYKKTGMCVDIPHTNEHGTPLPQHILGIWVVQTSDRYFAIGR